MSIHREYFQKVSVTGVRKWTDENGKKRQESRKFFQTMNPFNKDKNGKPKSYEQMLAEVTEEKRQWLESAEIGKAG